MSDHNHHTATTVPTTEGSFNSLLYRLMPTLYIHVSNLPAPGEGYICVVLESKELWIKHAIRPHEYHTRHPTGNILFNSEI